MKPRGFPSSATVLLRGYTGLLIGVTAMGFALTVTGVFLRQGIVCTLLISLGGAIIGASASLLIGELHDEGIRGDLRGILLQTLSHGVRSRDHDLAPFRHLWHHYFVTKVNGVYVWRYRAFDFRGSTAVGRLCTAVTARDSHGQEHPFSIEAGYRDSRFYVFCTSDEGIEPASMEYYPLLSSHSQGLHCGTGIEQTWDGVHIMYSCIITKTQLVATAPSNETAALATTEDVPEQSWEVLEHLWCRHFCNIPIFPRIIAGQESVAEIRWPTFKASN